VERVSGIQGVAWSARNRGVRLQHFFFIDTHFGNMDPMPPSSKHYRTKDGEGCYSTGRPEGEESAGLVNGRLWWSFK
jgi:hypothetical protein